MKYAIAFLVLTLPLCWAQTTTPTAFSGTTITFGLTPLSLPGSGTTLSGAETDTMVNVTTNNAIGYTTLIASSPLIGGRYERDIPAVSKWIQNHTAFAGDNFEAGFTATLGVVKGSTSHWGERAGIFLKYAPGGSTSFNLGADIEWNNLPGIAHNIPSIAIGPAFRF